MWGYGKFNFFGFYLEVSIYSWDVRKIVIGFLVILFLVSFDFYCWEVFKEGFWFVDKGLFLSFLVC